MSKITGDKNLKFGFFINTAFVVLEFTAGLAANSLALISDAAHNLTDSMSIGFSFLASKFAGRSASERQTFGYGRAAILAATINATVLVVTAALIYREAYGRLQHPQIVEGKIVAVIALVGIISNSAVAWFAARSRKDLNARVVFLSNLVDIVSSALALAAGLLIVFTKQTWVDPAISFIIATMLLVAAWQILREATIVLMEGVPEDISATKVKQALLDHPDVLGVDDLHIWTVGSQNTALSAHVVVSNEGIALKEADKLLAELKAMLAKEFGINHATLEPEFTAGPHEAERTDEGL